MADPTVAMLSCSADGSSILLVQETTRGARSGVKNYDAQRQENEDVEAVRELGEEDSEDNGEDEEDEDDEEIEDPTTLHEAAKRGDVNKVKALILRDGSLVLVKDAQGRTTLSFAAERGHLKTVVKMIESDAAVNAMDNDGKLALSYAAQKGHREVVAELLRYGALEAALEHHDTLDLFVAAAMGDLESVKGLVAKGVPSDTEASDGRTPLFYAAERGCSDVVQFLIEHGASITAKANSNHSSGRSDTLLTRAGRAGHMKIFQAIVDAGAPVNVRGDTDGKTPLISVACWDFFADVQLLIGHGASLRFEIVNEDECPLIPGTLKTLKSMCGATFEFESVPVRVVDRLQAICSHLQQRDATDETQEGAIVSFTSLIFRFCRLLLHFKKLRVPLS